MRDVTIVPLSPFADTAYGKICALLHDASDIEFRLIVYPLIAVMMFALIGLRCTIVALWTWYHEAHSRRRVSRLES